MSEPVFDYALQAMNYHVIDRHFELAIENGTDPSPQDINQLQKAIKKHQIAFFVNNPQSSDHIIDNLLTLAQQYHVPILQITETMPNKQNYITWIHSEFKQLEENTKKMNQNNVMVTVKDIGISFNNHQILKNLSFKLTTGSMTSLLGINGVGKTTLIKNAYRSIKNLIQAQLPMHNHILTLVMYPNFVIFDNDYPLSIRSFVALNLHHKLLPWLNKQEKQQLNDVLTATHLSNIQNNRLSERHLVVKKQPRILSSSIN